MHVHEVPKLFPSVELQSIDSFKDDFMAGIEQARPGTHVVVRSMHSDPGSKFAKEICDTAQRGVEVCVFEEQHTATQALKPFLYLIDDRPQLMSLYQLFFLSQMICGTHLNHLNPCIGLQK